MDAELFRNIRAVLATLYSDELSQRRIIDDASLDLTRINLNSNPLNNWHSILKEAEKTNRIPVLLNIVECEYGTNQNFRFVYDMYHHSIKATTQNNNSNKNREPYIFSLQTNKDDMCIVGLKPGGSTFTEVLNCLGEPKSRRGHASGNTILEYPDKGLYILVKGNQISLDTIVDTIIVENPYNKPVVHGLQINMKINDVKEICNMYCDRMHWVEQKNQWICYFATTMNKYLLVLTFLGDTLSCIQYCVHE
jgi:hypothetical protein